MQLIDNWKRALSMTSVQAGEVRRESKQIVSPKVSHVCLDLKLYRLE